MGKNQVGDGLGANIAMADRLNLRLEGSIGHGLESDDIPSGTALGLTVGFSFFTR